MGGVLEVRLEAQGQLQEPLPLRLHGRQVRLHGLAGGMVSNDQAVATVLHGAELHLSLFEFAHEFLQVL